MKKIKFSLIMAAAIFCAETVKADKWLDEFLATCRAPMGSKVELGVWNGDLTACKALADKTGIPMIAVWSNSGCGHCEILEKGLMSDAFKAWQKDCGLILCFTCSYDPKAGKQKGEYYYWCKGPQQLTQYPFMRFYWYKNGQKVVDYSVWGDKVDLQQGMYGGTYDKCGNNIINYIKNKSGLAPYLETPKTLTEYFGGTFDYEESASDRMEIDQDSKTLFFNLVREGDAATVATNNIVRLLGKDGTVLKNETVTWSANETNKTVTLNVSSYTAGLEEGDVLSVALVDANGTAQEQTNHVYFVSGGNSAKNPLWIGERVAGSGKALTANPKALTDASTKELSFGEWTMDLDVAKGTAKNAEGQAYTLALVAGTLWCPDCNNVDTNFLDYEKDGVNLVRQWAKDNNVALAVVEMPRFTNETIQSNNRATLLSRTPGASGYIEGGTASGRAYLTRKGVSDAEAFEQIIANQYIVTSNTADGGFHRPEDSNAYRMGVPVFVMLRKDGSVAARLTRFAAKSDDTAGNAENYLKRFDEMLKIASSEGEFADPAEIENNYPGDGAVAYVADGGSTNGVLCHADSRDVFKLSGFGGNAFLKTSVTGDGDAELEVSYVRLDAEGKEETIATATGTLNAGVDLEYTFEEKVDNSEGEYFYVKVAAPSVELKNGASDASTDFHVANTNAYNFFKYDITSAVVLVPQQGKTTAYAADDSDVVTMRLFEGEVYKIAGLKTAEVIEWLTPLDPEDPYCTFYTANKTEDARLKVAYGEGGPVTYQIWKTGEVGFTKEGVTVKENAGEVVITLERTGGKSGELVVDVTVDEEATTHYNMDGEAKFEFAGPAKLTWADDEDGAKEVKVKLLDDVRYDLDVGNVVLNIALAEGSVGKIGENSSYTIEIAENDQKIAGNVGFAATDPVYGKAKTVYAKASTGAKLTVARSGGSDGAVSVEVKANLAGVTIGGDVEEGGLISWDSHKADERTVEIGNIPAGKTAKISLANPKGGLKVVSASNFVNVVSVPDAAPEFAVQSALETLHRYTAFSNTYALKDAPSGRVAIAKLSGTLPAGLKASYDSAANALLIAGSTTAKPGTYVATYQAKDGTVAGTSIEISFSVDDPTDSKNYPGTANSAVLKSRTFKDVPLVTESGEGAFLAGTLQITIPQKGNLSAKYVSVSNTTAVSFSTKNWSGFDPGTKALSAVLTSRNGYEMEVDVDDDGIVSGVLKDPRFGDLDFETGSASLWSKTNPATAWKGYYTVALQTAEIEESRENVAPGGYGYLTLKMDTDANARAGKVTWAGMLPNGTAVSGNTLLTADGTLAYLPILKVTATDTLSALAAIDSEIAGEARSVASKDGVEAFWSHKEKTAAANVSWKSDINVYGGGYDKTADLADCCDEYYGATDMTVSFDTSTLSPLYTGETGAVEDQVVKVTTSTISFPSPRPSNMTISVNRSTGIVTGTVRIPYSGSSKTVSAKWKGVIMQGWGEGCGCSDGGDGLTYLPFVCGSYWLSDKVSYQNGTRTSTATVSRGGSVTIHNETN